MGGVAATIRIPSFDGCARESRRRGRERESAQERKTRADGGEPLEGCIKFLWSYIILFKMVFFFLFVTFHSADQLFLLLTVPPSLFQPPSRSRVPFWHEREEKREIERVRVTASVRGKRNSPVALIYGGNAPQLVQTEAPSSLISELGDFEVSMWEHACVCVCARVYYNIRLHLYALSPVTEWSSRRGS